MNQKAKQIRQIIKDSLYQDKPKLIELINKINLKYEEAVKMYLEK